MKFTRCDKCGKETDLYESLTKGGSPFDSNPQVVNLCEVCYKLFEDFIEYYTKIFH